MTDWLNVGKIVNTHGIRGEVRVISRTDFPESRYAPGSTLHLFRDGMERLPVTVNSWRKHKQFDLLTFEGYTNVNEVEPFKSALLKVEVSSLNDELSDDEFYYHDIIGLAVETEDGTYIGKVKEILSPGANDVWVVTPGDGGKDILIPYIEPVVKEVDLRKEKIVISPMEGLLEE